MPIQWPKLCCVDKLYTKLEDIIMVFLMPSEATFIGHWMYVEQINFLPLCRLKAYIQSLIIRHSCSFCFVFFYVQYSGLCYESFILHSVSNECMLITVTFVTNKLVNFASMQIPAVLCRSKPRVCYAVLYLCMLC